MRRLLLGAAIGVMVPASAVAQSSQFGVRGLGYPGHVTSVRAAGTAAAFAPIDELSSLNPASVGGLANFTASMQVASDSRRVENGGGAASVRTVRFPLVLIGGPVRRSPVSIAVSVSTYLDRDASLAASDSVTLRGQLVQVTDTLTSRGGIADIRGALAYRTGRSGAIGIGFHVLTGATRNEFRRAFSDSAFASGFQRAELEFAAVGVSAGIVQQLGRGLVLAGSARVDRDLRVRRDSADVARHPLPLTLSGGLKWRLTPRLDIGASGTRRTWSRTDASLTALGAPGAASTSEGAFGLEYQTNRLNPTRRPLRLGVRYAQLPFFLVRGSQPTELGASIGTGTRFGAERANLDLALEYLQRKDGTGRKERSVLLRAGITVRP